MKIRQILYATLSFLAVNIGLGSYILAASTFELKETSQEISGTDSESGVAFHASMLASDHVVIDANIGTKQIHANIDYARHAIRVRSVTQANGTPIALSVQDIVAFQKLLVSLPPKINTASRHGDALTSLVNLIASAPAGIAIDITSAAASFTSICKEIDGPGVATYTLGIIFKKTYHKAVTVGPVCYVPPARGRCGAGAGSDPGIGLVQRFTQECLNHDVCCDATMKSPPVCGLDCYAAFQAAASGFFNAPDCGKTAGNWTDNNGYTYVLTGGNSSGNALPFTGTVTVNPPCGTWNVMGTRTGTQIVFTATNPTAGSGECAASYTYNGIYTDCNTAGGTWNNSSGLSGTWSWNRTNTVGQMVLLSRAKAGPRPADK